MRLRGSAVLAIALLAALCAGPARAGSDDFERYLTAASRLYTDLEYERALEQLQQAKRFSRGAADDVQIDLYEGILLAELGKHDESTAAFRTALYLDPTAVLPLKVSPKLVAQFSRLQDQVRKELATRDPRMAAPVVVDDANAHAADAHAADAHAADSHAADSHAADSHTADSHAADSHGADSRSADSRSADSRSADAHAADSHAADSHAADSHAADSHAADATSAANGSAAPSDAPSNLVTDSSSMDANAPPGGLPASSSELAASKPARPVRVVSFVLGGVAVAAGGAGAWFGLQSKNEVAQASGAPFQDDTAKHLSAAQGPALAANVLFATAGTAAVGAAIAWFTSANEDTPNP